MMHLLCLKDGGMNEWRAEVLALHVCDSHQPSRQTSTLRMNQGLERLHCLAHGHTAESGTAPTTLNPCLPTLSPLRIPSQPSHPSTSIILSLSNFPVSVNHEEYP